MSTAAVSSLSILQELQSFYQNRQADLKQLGSALQSGDLASAQQAYKALAVLGEGGPFANSEPFSKSSRAQAFDAVGEALQAGDLARAQAEFATLTVKRPNAETASQTTPAAIVNLTSTQPNTATAADNGSSIYQELQAFRQQRQADVAQLGQDLQAGNLTAAQQDFSTLAALGQSGPNQNAEPFQQAGRAQDFEAIGQALQSGDLAGAQSAFANLEAAGGPTVGPEPVGPQPIVPPAVQGPAASTTAANGSALSEIVINLGGTSGTSGSSSTTPELVINLGQGSSS